LDRGFLAVSVRQTIVITSFFLLIALFSGLAHDRAGAEERWPPWQSYGEAENAARLKALKRKAANANDQSVLKRQIVQLKSAGKYVQAVPLAQRLLATAEKKGPQSLETADALETLASLYEAQKNYAAAEPLLKRSLDIREKAPGQPGVAATRARLAAAYDNTGKSGEAQALRGADLLAKKSGGGGAAEAPKPPAKVEIGRATDKDQEAAAVEAQRRAAQEQEAAQSNERAAASKTVEEPFSIPPADSPPAEEAPAQPGEALPPSDQKSAEAPMSIPPADAPAAAAPPPPPPEEKSAESPAAAPPPEAPVESDSAEASRVKPGVPEFSARSMMRRSAPPVAAPPSDEAAPSVGAGAPEPAPAAPDGANGASGGAQNDDNAPAAEAAPGGSAGGGMASPEGGYGGGIGAGLPAAGGAAPPSITMAPAPPPAAPVPVQPSGGAAPPGNSDWQIVPVYWGTDRAVQPNAQRLAFGSDRARKLQLGMANITVPKTHEVPKVERPWVVKIPYFDVTVYAEAEDPKKHFTIEQIKALSKEELLAQVKERLKNSVAFKDQALVFVHGYNTSFDNALYRTAQIAYDLGFDGAPFLYSWPSGGAVASYTYDRESAQASEPYLRQFLEMVVKETGAKQVSIIAHSMGNQPLMDVLRDMRNAAPEGVEISQVILAAPDVDADSFANLAKTIQGLAHNVTLYVASNDRALIVSRNFWGSYRAGDVPPAGPLVLSGIDTIDVTAASTDVFAINHSGYAVNNKLLGDIGELLKTGLRPPEMRALKPGKVSGQGGDYWRYVSPPAPPPQ
jgi:esterase/lipase superfamily enzyme/tetratricopeptide (TPR) repeat protein